MPDYPPIDGIERLMKAMRLKDEQRTQEVVSDMQLQARDIAELKAVFRMVLEGKSELSIAAALLGTLEHTTAKGVQSAMGTLSELRQKGHLGKL